MAVSMYRMQPIFSADGPVELPTCMYRLSNVHTEFSQSNQNGAGNEVSTLEAVQEDILRKLSALKSKLEQLRCMVKQPPVAAAKEVARRPVEAAPEVVVRASPKRPPFGLLALQALWGGDAVAICGHCHSTLRRRPSEALLRRFEAAPVAPLVQVRIVWTEAAARGLETVISAAGLVLRGESTLLRLLSRLAGSGSPDHLPPPEAARLDAILDLVEAGAVEALEAAPGGWLLPQGPSIADAALWSLLKAPDAPRCPFKLNAWLKNCDSTFAAK